MHSELTKSHRSGLNRRPLGERSTRCKAESFRSNDLEASPALSGPEKSAKAVPETVPKVSARNSRIGRVTPINWREQKNILVSQRHVWYARAYGCRIEVYVYLGKPTPPRLTGDDCTGARVERKRASDGGYDRLGSLQWSDAKPATLAEARAWCVATAAASEVP